jgi:HK97 family phage portal protein
MMDKSLGMLGVRREVEAKASVSEVQIMSPKGHDWASNDWRKYAKEGFGRNPTIYRCVQMVATNAASVKPKVKVNGEYVEEHPLLDLLSRPNPITGGQEFRIESYAWSQLAGNVFTEKKAVGGRVTELHNWQPYMMSIDRSSTNIQIPLRYWANKNGRNATDWDVNPVDGSSDMMHLAIFNPDPEAGFMGQSPLMAAANAGDQLNAASAWRYNMLRNDCKPSLLINAKTANPQQLKDARREVNSNKKGFRNAGEHLVVSGEVDVKPLNMSPKDADWLNGSKFNKQEICEVFGVPGQLIGIEGSQTYANYAEARYAFYIQTILPLVDLYFDELNRWLAPSYGENVTICYDKSEIDALALERQPGIDAILASDVATINEKREMLGLEPDTNPEADQIFIDPNKLPLGFDIFMDEEKPAEDLAKAFIKMGVKPEDAQVKAMELFNCHHAPQK